MLCSNSLWTVIEVYCCSMRLGKRSLPLEPAGQEASIDSFIESLPGDEAEKLLGLRNTLKNDKLSYQVFFETFITCWETLSSLRSLSSLNLTRRQLPLSCAFLSNEIRKVVDRILKPIYCLLYRNEKVSCGRCSLITGAGGVGKTAVMETVSTILALMFPDRLVCGVNGYQSYSRLPSRLLIEYTGIAAPEDATLLDVLSILEQHNQSVVFFADDVHFLHTRTTNLDSNKAILCELVQLARSTNHFCILSERNGLTDYNQSLDPTRFVQSHLIGIRDQVEFAAACHSHNRTREPLTHADICALFLYSGGIGRLFLGCLSIRSSDIWRRMESIYLYFSIEDNEDSSDYLWLKLVLHEMMSRVKSRIADRSFDPWLHSTSINLREAANLVKITHKVKDAAEAVAIVEKLAIQCCDDGLFLSPESGVLELVRPGILAAHGSWGVFDSEHYDVFDVVTGWHDFEPQRLTASVRQCEMQMLTLMIEIYCQNENVFPVGIREFDDTLDRSSSSSLSAERFDNVIVYSESAGGYNGCMIRYEQELTVFHSRFSHFCQTISQTAFRKLVADAVQFGNDFIAAVDRSGVKLRHVVILCTKIIPSQWIEDIDRECQHLVHIYERSEVLCRMGSTSSVLLRYWISLQESN